MATPSSPDCADLADKSSHKPAQQAFKDLGLKREELVITTKIFFGTGREDPNQRGLSRKHLIEGTRASLKRMQLDYVDIVYAHRPDPSVPMEEIVRAFNWIIDQGWAFYCKCPSRRPSYTGSAVSESNE